MRPWYRRVVVDQHPWNVGERPMRPYGLKMVVVHLHILFGNTAFRRDFWNNPGSKRRSGPPRETKS